MEIYRWVRACWRSLSHKPTGQQTGRGTELPHDPVGTLTMSDAEREATLLALHAGRVALRDRADALIPIAADAFDAGHDVMATLERAQAMDRERARIERQIAEIDPRFDPRSRSWS